MGGLTTAFLMLCMAIPMAGQTDATAVAPTTAMQQEAKKSKNEITVTGCVAKQSTDYVLIQADAGNTYELEKSRKMKLRSYLGKQVEITGTPLTSIPTSSDYLARTGAGSPVTIRIDTIKTLADRCSGQ